MKLSKNAISLYYSIWSVMSLYEMSLVLMCTVHIKQFYLSYWSIDKGNIFFSSPCRSPSVMLGLALASFPSGIYNRIVAMIHPWVIFRLFSTTSTPNWTISPELNSWFSVSDWSLLLLTKVPLLLFVSCEEGLKISFCLFYAVKNNN